MENMSRVELLGLIMARLGFVWKISALIFPLFGTLHIMYIIFNDDFLSEHINLTLALIALFSFTCCLLNLSKICVLRRKSHAMNKSVDQLWDSDLMYDNETDEVPHYKLSFHCKDLLSTLKNFIYKNPLEFCKFRPAYGMLLLTGFVSLLVFIIAFRRVKEWSIKEDFYCVVLELTVPTIMLISVIYFIANSGFYGASKNYDSYIPFEEFIHVPMKTMVAKTVAVFVTGGGTYWLLALFILSIIALCVISSNYLYHVSEIDNVLKNLLPPIYPDQRKFLRTVLIAVAVICINGLLGMMVAAFIEVKQSILGVIEKNWQRNIGAISFLLNDIEVETLKNLKAALEHKRAQPLTEKEKLAFKYLNLPIWRTKQPFLLRKFEEESELLQIRESDNQNKPEKFQPHAAGELEQAQDIVEQSKQEAVAHEVATASQQIQGAVSDGSRHEKPSAVPKMELSALLEKSFC